MKKQDPKKKILISLKRLRELDLFRKDDIEFLDLLHQSCGLKNEYNDYEGNVPRNHANDAIFHYLVAWDPTALEDPVIFLNLFERDEYTRPIYRVETVKMVLKAGLKYFPNHLGFLVCTGGYTRTPPEMTQFAWAMKEVAPNTKPGWSIIEECLEETKYLKLHEPDPFTNMYPFMVAALDQSCPHVDLVYYLLRKDPSVMVPFSSCE